MKKLLIVILLLLGVLALVFALSVETEEPLTLTTGYRENPDLTLAPLPDNIYHAMSPNVFTGWTRRSDVSLIERAEEVAGKEIAWVSVSNTWFPRGGAPGCLESKMHPFDPGIHFPVQEVEAVLRSGHIPSIRMLPYDRCISNDFEGYKPQTFIDGEHDAALRRWAQAAKRIPSPMLISFGVEVNGDWFPWNMKHNGGYERGGYGSPELYDGHERFQDAYRHIIDLFREEGVENVTWVYHVNCIWPSEIGDAASSVDGYYPGDDYIDWIGVSCYGSQNAENAFWWDMSYTFDDSYELLVNSSIIGKDKPIALMEYGVTEEPRKPDWMNTFFSDVVAGKYPRLKALSWWESRFCLVYNEQNCSAHADIRVESSPESIQTYRTYISEDLFVGEPVFR